MKLVHAADLHLDSPLRGLERYEGAPVEQMRGATRHALENLVTFCIEQRAALLLIAGDLYDGSWRDYSTGLFFAAQMSKLRHAEVQVAFVRGNHDAASVITDHLKLPDNVRELSSRAPETIRYDALGVAVHGQGFARRSVKDDLAAAYPEALADHLNVGLLHTCATGREGHEPYAPCSLETLTEKGYHYWALGHVHRHEILSRDPWVVFPGNLQGRHVRETGPKGAVLIDTDGQRIRDVSFHALDVLRWAHLTVDLAEAQNGHDAVELARAAIDDALVQAEGRTLAIRLDMQGASAAHDALVDNPERWESMLRATASDVAADGVWLEKIRWATWPRADAEQLAQRDDAVGQVARALRAAQAEGADLDAMTAALAELRVKLPSELRERDSDGGLRLDDPTTVRELLADVERLLLPRLTAGAREP
jgi:DNA repair exonuclease SbcCD nuclease subunit